MVIYDIILVTKIQYTSTKLQRFNSHDLFLVYRFRLFLGLPGLNEFESKARPIYTFLKLFLITASHLFRSPEFAYPAIFLPKDVSSIV